MRAVATVLLIIAGTTLPGCAGDDEPTPAEPRPSAAATLPPEVEAKADCKFALVPALVGAYQAAERGDGLDTVRKALGEDLPQVCAELDPATLAEVAFVAKQEAIALVSGALRETEPPAQ